MSMSPKLITIQYNFKLPGGDKEQFEIILEKQNLLLVDNLPEIILDWTKLNFHQCPVCPLTIDKYPNCPIAVHLVKVIHGFKNIASHDEVYVEIVTEERKIFQKTTAQRAIGSMMGLLFATSGCPHTAYFRPMARYHLPLAGEDETIYRTTSMYLLAQYFKRLNGEEADFNLEGLTLIYKNIQIVNNSIAERLRSATATDSSLNAVIFLDMFAKTIPYVIKGNLEEIRHLFKPYFEIGKI